MHLKSLFIVTLVAVSACTNSSESSAKREDVAPETDKEISEVLKILEEEFFLGMSDANITTYELDTHDAEKILAEKKASETFNLTDFHDEPCIFGFSSDNETGLRVLGSEPWHFGHEKLDELVKNGKVKNIISVEHQGGETENCKLYEIEIYFTDGHVFTMFFDGTT